MSTFPTGVAAGASQVLTYSYGAENRLNTITDQNGVVQDQYFYNWRGDEVADVTPTKTTRYTYDSRDLLTEVDDGTNQTTYAYDGAGRRIGQTVNGVTTRYIVDPSSQDFQALENVNSTGGASASFTYGSNRISVAYGSQSSPEFYLSDASGTVDAITNLTGTSEANYSYEAFGTVVGPDQPTEFGFDGEDVSQADEPLNRPIFDPRSNGLSGWC